MDGVVVVANMLVRAAASLGTLAFQGPGQADRASVALGDDV